MGNYKKNPNEQALNRMLQPQSDDDVIIQAAKHGDVEIEVYKKTNDVMFINDPEHPGMTFPITVSKTVRRLDDNGESFGSGKEVAACKFGCFVKSSSIAECRWCHRNACKKHLFKVSELNFCRKWPCSVIGRTYQILKLVYRVIRFCLRSVTGLNAE